MVGRHDRSARKSQRLLGNHQKCWIWGRHLVQETLAAGRWPMLELHLAKSADDSEAHALQERARELDVAVQLRTSDDLQKLCRSRDHQGFVAKMAEFPYTTVPELLDGQSATHPPLYLICDSIQDPFNLGAILRTSEALQVSGVLIGRQNQVGVTSHVARSSAGAVNHLLISRVDDLVTTIGLFRDRGIRVVGASEKADCPLTDCDMRRATAVVVGNEGQGIRAEVWKQCDQRIAIPLTGQMTSLNAAVACGIILYEASRQRQQD